MSSVQVRHGLPKPLDTVELPTTYNTASLHNEPVIESNGDGGIDISSRTVPYGAPHAQFSCQIDRTPWLARILSWPAPIGIMPDPDRCGVVSRCIRSAHPDPRASIDPRIGETTGDRSHGIRYGRHRLASGHDRLYRVRMRRCNGAVAVRRVRHTRTVGQPSGRITRDGHESVAHAIDARSHSRHGAPRWFGVDCSVIIETTQIDQHETPPASPMT